MEKESELPKTGICLRNERKLLYWLDFCFLCVMFFKHPTDVICMMQVDAKSDICNR